MNADGMNTADEHQGDGDQRAADLVHGLVGGVARAQALADVALDVLHHDDGVVDHDADGQHQAEQREIVEREAERRQHGEGADQRHRDGDDRDDRGAPGLQEQDDDHDDEDHGLEQGLDHRVDRLRDEHRSGCRRCRSRGPAGKDFDSSSIGVLDARRRWRARWSRAAGRCRAAPATCRRDSRCGCSPAAPSSTRATSRTRVDAAVGVGLDDDVAELLGVGEPAQRLDVELEGAGLRHRRLVDRRRRRPARSAPRSAATTSPAVRLRDGELLRIEPDAHRIVARAEDGDVADAVEAREHVLDLQRGVVAEVELVAASRPARSGGSPSAGRATSCVTVTPIARTSSGRRGSAIATRFCTSTWACSRSVPSLKVTVSDMLPSLVDCDDM